MLKPFDCTLYEHLVDLSDLSTWENCLLWDFDDNTIQNINILEGAAENFLTLKLLVFTPGFFLKMAK